MLKKEKCSYTGKLQTNPAMSKLQDLEAEVFKPLGFRRGLKKSETQKSHLSRDRYIAKQQEQRLSELAALEHQFSVQQRETDIAITGNRNEACIFFVLEVSARCFVLYSTKSLRVKIVDF